MPDGRGDEMLGKKCDGIKKYKLIVTEYSWVIVKYSTENIINNVVVTM